MRANGYGSRNKVGMHAFEIENVIVIENADIGTKQGMITNSDKLLRNDTGIGIKEDTFAEHKFRPFIGLQKDVI